MLQFSSYTFSGFFLLIFKQYRAFCIYHYNKLIIIIIIIIINQNFKDFSPFMTKGSVSISVLPSVKRNKVLYSSEHQFQIGILGNLGRHQF